MRVGEARDNGSAVEIDHRCALALKRFCIRVRAYKHDLTVFNRDGFGTRLALVHGVNPSVQKYGIRSDRRRCWRAREQAGRDQQQSSEQ
jgi:hypothetical protein